MAQQIKNVLFLNYEFPPLGGGASPVSYEMASRLAKTKKYKIEVITMSYTGLAKQEKINDYLTIYRVPSWRRQKEICSAAEQLTYLISAFFFIRQRLKKHSYAFVHAHFFLPTGILAYLLKKIYGLNYIITGHGSDLPGFNQDRFVFLHKFTPPLIRLIAKEAKIITTPSLYLKKLILKKINPNLKAKIKVIANGIDTSYWQPQAKEKIIISTGRLLARKGFDTLIQAVADGNLGWRVYICGAGPEAKRLKKLAQKAKTTIVFCGWLDNKSQKFKNLIGQASIFVLASWAENASLALLEAMSAGCALVAAKSTGNIELVGNSGFLFAPGQSQELKIILKNLTTDSRLLAAKQKAARARAKEKFSWDLIINSYSAVWEKMAG